MLYKNSLLLFFLVVDDESWLLAFAGDDGIVKIFKFQSEKDLS